MMTVRGWDVSESVSKDEVRAEMEEYGG